MKKAFVNRMLFIFNVLFLYFFYFFYFLYFLYFLYFFYIFIFVIFLHINIYNFISCYIALPLFVKKQFFVFVFFDAKFSLAL